MSGLPGSVPRAREPLGIAGSVLELVGATPLVRLQRVVDGLTPGVEVWVKLEFLNPGGSVKDRAGVRLLLDGIERGHSPRAGA